MYSRPLLSLSLFALLACGGGNEPPKSAESETPAAASTNATMPQTDLSMSPAPAATTPVSAAENPPPPPPPPPEPALTDPQIAAIVDVGNVGEIEQAKLAATKSKDARVKKFAAMMVKHHSEAKTKQGKLMDKAKLSPQPNPMSEKMAKDGAAAVENLRGTAAGEFDKAYVALQVKEHRELLDALDQKLIAAAQNAEMKAFLNELRPRVAEHLQAAQTLGDQLAQPKTGAR